MRSLTWVADLASLAVAGTLLFAGASKLLSPRPLARGLGTVFAWAGLRPRLSLGVARVVACVELVAALLVATAWVSPLGYLMAVALGLGISGFAVSAIVLGRRAPCGCFGESDGSPVGLTNVLAGLAVSTGSVVAYAGHRSGTGEGLLLSLASTIALAVALFTHRSRLAGPFGRHFRSFSRLAEGADNNG